MSELIRLNKWLAENAGIARRKADDAIAGGLVLVNGVLAEMGMKIDPDVTQVSFQGKIIEPVPTRNSFAFHKPPGYVTSLQLGKEAGLPISELLPPESGLKPAGRLDTDSEGLLIVSNDGDLIYAITHPRFEIQKEYLVLTSYPVNRETLYQMRAGILLEDGWCVPDQIERDGDWVRIVLHEGRKREIRRLIHAVHHHVERLIRVRIGGVWLDDLEPGALRSLTETEIASLH